MQPGSFDESLMTEWSLWVLDHGLPRLPTTVEVGQTVPIARFVGVRFAAVMHVQWVWSESHENDYISTETELFFRLGDTWDPADGSGGASWFDPPFQRPPSIGAREVHGFTQTGSVGRGGSCQSIEGIAGVEATHIEVIDRDGTMRRPIESAFGAFIACTDGDHEAILRVLDQAGNALLTTRFSSPSFGYGRDS